MVGLAATIVVGLGLNRLAGSPSSSATQWGLSATLTFLSLIVWAVVLGPIGAVMAVPLTLLVKAVLVDVDPQLRWIGGLLGDRQDPGDQPLAAPIPAQVDAGSNTDGPASAGSAGGVPA